MATKEAGGIVLLKSYQDYYEGYTDSDGNERPGYRDMIQELLEKFPLSEPSNYRGEKTKGVYQPVRRDSAYAEYPGFL